MYILNNCLWFTFEYRNCPYSHWALDSISSSHVLGQLKYSSLANSSEFPAFFRSGYSRKKILKSLDISGSKYRHRHGLFYPVKHKFGQFEKSISGTKLRNSSLLQVQKQQVETVLVWSIRSEYRHLHVLWVAKTIYLVGSWNRLPPGQLESSMER